MLDSFLKANLQLIFIEVKKATFGGSLIFNGSFARRDDNSMVIQTHYVPLVDLVNAKL